MTTPLRLPFRRQVPDVAPTPFFPEHLPATPRPPDAVDSGGIYWCDQTQQWRDGRAEASERVRQASLEAQAQEREASLQADIAAQGPPPDGDWPVNLLR